MRIVDSLIQELDQEGKTTRRLLERVPEDRLAWKPHPKSMTLGQLSMHIAACNGMVARMGAQDTFELPADVGTAPQPQTRAEILEAFDKGLSGARAQLDQTDNEEMVASWSMTSGGQPFWTMPRAGLYRVIMCSHQYHHRGQLTVYLRLLDVPIPSVYGPSADENPFQK